MMVNCRIPTIGYVVIHSMQMYGCLFVILSVHRKSKFARACDVCVRVCVCVRAHAFVRARVSVCAHMRSCVRSCACAYAYNYA